jgi:hypothetical protein
MRVLGSLAFLALLFSTLGVATAGSLCSDKETTYFSCKVTGSGKILSLCGKVHIDTNNFEMDHNGWLQYRFGTPEKPELVYPQKKEGSVNRFLGMYNHSFQGSLWPLSFRIGSYYYELDDWPEGNVETSFIGIRVAELEPRSGDGASRVKKEATLSCESEIEIHQDFLELVQRTDPNR